MDPDLSWLAVLEHHAGRTPQQPLAIFGDETVTYGEMSTRAAGLAAGLHERGVRAGDVVGLLSYNCTEFLETIFAANDLGAIAMPINWRLAAPELRYILDHSEARALVCDEPARRPRRRSDGGPGARDRPCVHRTGGSRRVDRAGRCPEGRGNRRRAFARQATTCTG